MKAFNLVRSLTTAVVASLFLAGAATAGLYVEQTTRSSGEGQGMEMRVRAWADGGKVRVEFLDSNSSFMPVGSYLLTLDGAKTVYLIRPEDKTYSVWNMDEVFGLLGSMSEASGGMVKIDFKDPFSETLGNEPGGTLLGYHTVHRTWRSGYTMDMKIAFMNQSSRMETVTNAWMTDEIRDPSLQIWFGARPPTTGDPELDEIITGGIENIEGLVLRLEQQTTTTNKKGKQSSSSTVMEVTLLREETPNVALFEMPSDYRETPLLPMGEQMEGGQDESPMKSLKGLFGRKKKKDG
jgi:hypothetical protein